MPAFASAHQVLGYGCHSEHPDAASVESDAPVPHAPRGAGVASHKSSGQGDMETVAVATSNREGQTEIRRCLA